jgi:hypothetical protein
MIDCSADLNPDAAGIPFQEQIRPGMVVAWDTSAGEYTKFAVGGKSYTIVMCLVGGVGGEVKDVRRLVVNPATGEKW